MSIRVFLVDGHPVAREGLRSAIEARSSDIQVVGEASDGLAALETVGKIGVDVYVMDVSMPVLNGIETTRRLNAEARPPQAGRPGPLCDKRRHLQTGTVFLAPST